MRPLLLAILGALILSLGCAKPPADEKKPSQSRRMMKPGDTPGAPQPQKP